MTPAMDEDLVARAAVSAAEAALEAGLDPDGDELQRFACEAAEAEMEAQYMGERRYVESQHRWFELGYFDGARERTELSYHEVIRLYPEIPVADAPAYIQGTLDGIKGDSWRLQWLP